MGDDNIPEAAVIDSGGNIRDAAAYQAAATLASLISAPIDIDSNEMTRNAPLRPDSRYNEAKEPNGKHYLSHDNRSTGGTRKFTRDDDVNLIRGILKHGKSSWKKIWQETPQLQHIKHAALKDRGRSRRFQNALEQAKRDPSLLDRPFELLGDANSSWYEKDSSEAGAGGTKRSAGVMKQHEGNANKRPKLTNSATTKSRTYSKGLKNLQNGEIDVFPGWNFETFQRKNSTQYERLWSHKSLDGISVRSRVGMREMMEKMETHRVDAKGAYEILMSEGKGKYFVRTGNKNDQEDEFPGWTCVQGRKNNAIQRMWSHTSLVGVCVKSKVGMREMVEKMKTYRVDAKAAYDRLMIEGKSKYFIRAGSKFCGKIVAANGSLVDVEEWNKK